MGRTPRRWSESGYYHVVTRGNNRQRVFREPADQVQYLRVLAVALASQEVALSHYCLMPNHTHLLVSVRTPAHLSQAMHQLQRRYALYMRRTYQLSGHLWQGRYHSFPIEDESYLLECARYIERNPLDARLVATLEAYPWTSYAWYATGQPSHVALTSSPSYAALGPTPTVRQVAYRAYVTTTRPYDRARHQQLQEITVGV